MIDHVLTFASEPEAKSAVLAGDATVWDASCTIPGVQIITGETPSEGADENGDPFPPRLVFAPGWSVLIARDEVDAALASLPQCVSIRDRTTGEQIKGPAIVVSPVFA